MIITGIEVIKGNTGYNPGNFDPAPGEKIDLTYGDKLRVNTSLEYQGPTQAVTLYGAIGNRKVLVGFDEIISAEAKLTLPTSTGGFTLVQVPVEIPITPDISPGEGYDLYCKIKEYPEAGQPEIDDVITITGIPPTYELLEETIFPYAYVYDGDTEVSTFTFKTDPFMPASWIAGKLAAACQAQVEKAGGQVLELRVYVDKRPLLWADWRIEIIGIPATTPTAGLGMTLGIAWWAAAILAALAIIGIIVLTWAIKTIVSSFTRKPLTEEVKKAWTRETLIKVINDFEVKLERTPTPPEQLEKKSDQELRDYCNELAKAVAPPVQGLGLAIAAAGVLGLGALTLMAFAMAKPGEKA